MKLEDGHGLAGVVVVDEVVSMTVRQMSTHQADVAG
jgi:hypothetical protein